ncbi:DUF397 domain-containing protein [Streptomyces sp. NPDC006711]|uniref:DUF397 domain-containing protein n=1 Tax=unclassified Streptomyces TaxID=2593676 RepID=UPI0033D12F84
MSEAPNWHKSSYSGGNTNDCVEIADNQPRVLVRDTKDHSMGILTPSRAAWQSFVGYAKRIGG